MTLPTRTPSSERLHIAVTGKRNSGKSSLVNAITGQPTSIVSDTPGTTTDPVRKAMEIPGIGPCLFIDTAGFDDDAGKLGELRTKETLRAIERTDIAIVIFRDCDALEEDWYKTLKSKNIPVIPLINIFSQCHPERRAEPGVEGPSVIAARVKEICGDEPILVNAASRGNISAVFSKILEKMPEDYGSRSITEGLVKPGDSVLLVMPQNIQAPKGRLILPQVQTLRELLDKNCSVMSCTTDGLASTLARLSQAPDVIITDSQVFGQVWRLKPESSVLTSFSILFAAYKGDSAVFLKGARALDSLTPGSKVLIAEACTHAPATEDIGRIQIPRILRSRYGDSLQIEVVAGAAFPTDLSPYDLIIHCGACMFNRRYVLSRILAAQNAGIPITNYGMTIAWAKGILDKVFVMQSSKSKG